MGAIGVKMFEKNKDHGANHISNDNIDQYHGNTRICSHKAEILNPKPQTLNPDLEPEVPFPKP